MPACKLVSLLKPVNFSRERSSIARFRYGRIHNVDDIAGKGWSRSDRLPRTSRARYAQFSRKITRAIGYRDMPLVLRAACLSNRNYRVSSRSLAGVSHPLEIHVRRVITFHYPVEHTHRAGINVQTKNFDPIPRWPSSRMIFGRRIDRRKEKMTVSHRRRRFAVVNNFSQESPRRWRTRGGTKTDTLRAQGRSTKFNTKHFVINTLPSLRTGGCGFELLA